MTAAADTITRRNRRSALFATLLVAGMVALGYASVPLYSLFCRVTGFGGTTQRVDGAALPKPLIGKTMSVRFDANRSNDLPWRFAPEHAADTITIGAQDLAFFTAENLSDAPTTGVASFNVSPAAAGKYFTKIECFCFTQQTLAPRQKVRMPVLFYVDPGIVDDLDARDIRQITLSYTFFPVDPGKQGG